MKSVWRLSMLSLSGVAYPISRKMLRISSRTLRSGCSAPPLVGMPSASKLYFLNVDVFHFPL